MSNLIKIIISTQRRDGRDECMLPAELQIKDRKIKEKIQSRFIEIDFLRGFAIIFMVFLHFMWDLDYFGLVPLNQDIYQLQKIVPSIFFILVGVCLAVTYNRSIKKQYNDKKNYSHFIVRGLKILGLGIVISIGTMIFIPDRPIFFGVLHCIGLSIILTVPFLKRNTNPATLHKRLQGHVQTLVQSFSECEFHQLATASLSFPIL